MYLREHYWFNILDLRGVLQEAERAAEVYGINKTPVHVYLQLLRKALPIYSPIYSEIITTFLKQESDIQTWSQSFYNSFAQLASVICFWIYGVKKAEPLRQNMFFGILRLAKKIFLLTRY